MSIIDILKKNQLSITDSRRKILNLFTNKSGAISHGEIEKLSGEKFDRVTVYRTLQTFVEKGIIHTIPTKDNSVRYALCKDNCTEGHHHDNHLHFTCNNCGKTECLSDVEMPTMELPANYKAASVDVVVNGFCSDCR
jgi:Fur family transcriptional regulator, ferric uptake regulator